MTQDFEVIKSEFISESPAHTEAAGEFTGRHARAGLYIALSGELGGGKTTFVRGLARGLGATAHVQSPTFVLMREYAARITLHHADFYRLEKQSDLSALDLGQCLATGILAAEWAGKFRAPEGASVLAVDFDYIDDSKRKLTFQNATADAAAIAREISNAFNTFKQGD